MIMENYPGHHFHLKIVSTKPTKKQVHLIIKITGLSKKKAHKLIHKGGYIKKNIPKKVCSRINECLTSCNLKGKTYKRNKRYKFKDGYR